MPDDNQPVLPPPKPPETMEDRGLAVHDRKKEWRMDSSPRGTSALAPYLRTRPLLKGGLPRKKKENVGFP